MKRIGHFKLVAAFACLLPLTHVLSAETPPLVLLVQPTLNEKSAAQTWRPLADYLERQTGRRVTLLARPNFFAHWETVRRNEGFDLVLDDAHFTDYRVLKHDYRPLAKLPGTLGYGLFVRHPRRVPDPLALVGKPIASFGPLSLGATRLGAMFPNPSRRPSIVEIEIAAEGVALLRSGEVDAAMLPTDFAEPYVRRGEIAVLSVTEPTPNLALSAAPHLDATLREKIAEILLNAAKTETGAVMLKELGIDKFERATPLTYANQARALKDLWGY